MREAARLLRYAYGGGRPPASSEELICDAAGSLRYLAAHPWPRQPPFDEIGRYAGQISEARLGRLLELARPIARCELPASRRTAAWEGIEVTTGDQTFQRYWDDEGAPDVASSLLSELRGLIGELRQAPVAVLRGRLTLADPLRAGEPVVGSAELVLELVNRGSEPVRIEPLGAAPLDLGARGVRLRAFDADDRLLPRAHSPLDLRGAAPVGVQERSRLAELSPGATHSYRLHTSLRELAAHVPRRARIECLVGLSFDACGGALGDGYLMPAPLLVEFARIH